MAKLLEYPIVVISCIAGEDVTKKHFAQLEATGNPPEAIVAGDGEGHGIFLDDADEGQAVRVAMIGVTTAIRGASAITAGNLLDSDADGHATPIGSGVGSRRYAAMSIGNPAAAGEEFPVLLVPGIDSDTDTT